MYFYRAGTLDPITVYISSDLGTPHAIPVLSSGYGRIPPIWIGEIDPDPQLNFYRVRVFDQYSTLVEDVDFLPGGVETLHEDEGPPPATGVLPDDVHLNKTGDLIFTMANTLSPRAGCVLCNGQTIGKAGSTANRANDDTKNLYFWLWGQDLLNGAFPISNPGRGATAQGDWDALKTLKLPDFQGMTVVGMDAMGGGAATDRLKTVPYLYGNNKMLNASGGEAFHTLAVAELAAHAHIMDAHNHTGTAADHVHGFQTASMTNNGAHTHPNRQHGCAYRPAPPHRAERRQQRSSGWLGLDRQSARRSRSRPPMAHTATLWRSPRMAIMPTP